MPLVVPGITDNSSHGDKTQGWESKLVGKTLSESESNETMFCQSDLPQQARIIKPGMMVTKDFNPDRLNVHVNDDGMVSHVVHG